MIRLNDKKTLADLRIKIDQDLELLAKKHGLKISAGSCKYEGDGSAATFKLEVAVINENGTVESKERAAFRSLASLYGFKPEHLDRELTIGGRRMKVNGLMPRRAKPVLMRELSSGKEYLYPVEPIVAMLEKAGA